MHSFQFSLEPLMLIRKAKLEQQELRFASATTAYNQLRVLQQNNKIEVEKTWNNVGNSVKDRPNDEIALRNFAGYFYLERLKEQNKELSDQMHKSHLEMEEERKKYITAKTELHVLENLRAKQLETHKRAVNKQHDAEINEMHQASKHCQLNRAYAPTT